MTQNKTLTDNEAFEKWFGETYNDLQFNKAGMIDAWQAATKASESEINSLKQRMENLSELLKDRQSDLDFEFNRAEQNELMCNELQANNERLREALREIASMTQSTNLLWWQKTAREALSATAKQSLIEHDNEVLERAAKVFDLCIDSKDTAEAIRALKA